MLGKPLAQRCHHQYQRMDHSHAKNNDQSRTDKGNQMKPPKSSIVSFDFCAKPWVSVSFDFLDLTIGHFQTVVRHAVSGRPTTLSAFWKPFDWNQSFSIVADWSIYVQIRNNPHGTADRYTRNYSPILWLSPARSPEAGKLELPS